MQASESPNYSDLRLRRERNRWFADEGTGFELLVRGRVKRLSRLLTRPVAWDGSAAGGTTRPPRSALREQTPIAVSELADQYLMRRVTWASSSSPLHPAKGHGSPSVVYRAVQWDQPRSAFSMQTVRAVLSRARALRAITRSAPARPPKGRFLTSLGGGKLQLRRCHHQFTSVLRAVP